METDEGRLQLFDPLSRYDNTKSKKAQRRTTLPILIKWPTRIPYAGGMDAGRASNAGLGAQTTSLLLHFYFTFSYSRPIFAAT